MDKDTIDTIIKLIEKLKKRDQDILISLVVFSVLFVYLFDSLAATLTNNPNAYPYPLNIILPILPLGFIVLLIGFTTSAYISKKTKLKDDVEDDDAAITKLDTFNQRTLNTLIDQFELSHTQAKGLSTRMRQWKSDGYFEMQDKLDLANWCKISDDTRKPAREIARKISELVFGRDVSKK